MIEISHDRFEWEFLRINEKERSGHRYQVDNLFLCAITQVFSEKDDIATYAQEEK